ncbi:probable L-type lectin-domain containing receptor kinase VII.2 [Trifolium pratense]|nr:probable L-type lectin-domain containing receptor kinase VII.2 [Trifolium pratense]
MSQLKQLLILLHTVTIFICCVSTTEFVYNTNFNSTNIMLYGNATIQNSILTLTNGTYFSIGRAFYPKKVLTKPLNSSTLLPFATSFIFSVSPIKNIITGHSFAFIFTPSRGLNGTTSAQYTGLFNYTNEGNPNNHVFGVEFDIIRNEEFNDTNGNHVGIDVNSLKSLTSHEAGYWGGKYDNEFKVLNIKSGENYQVWIEFMHSKINVTMARAGQKRPHVPLISINVNLSGVLMDETYVGFCAATGKITDSSKILAWSFSNTNFSIGDALVTNKLPSFVLHEGWFSGAKAIAVGVTSVVCILIIGCGCAVVFILSRRNEAEEEIEEWELEYWPHRIRFEEIHAATRGFSEENVISVGGNGKVYKGILQGVEVAVKRIPQEREDGMREFLAEVSSIGRMKHRNLVGLRGWCKKEKGNLILVYDFMNNGSLDKWIFECEEGKMLTWEERIQVLKNVAAGILYLHEGWEVKVLHRDIKANNVLLDKEMNARLGDFGLALMHEHHGQVAGTTKVLGTLGYIAPEVIRTGKASTMSDVFGFGILLLEVICGRRPIEEHKPGLTEWVKSLMVLGQLHNAVDERLKAKGGYPIEEAERFLHLGLLCSNSDPSVRPIMRQVVKMLEGEMDSIESDEGNMQKSLLGRLKSTAMWSRTESGYNDHPTFEEIMMLIDNSKTSTSGSTAIQASDSDIIWEGR